MKRKGRISEILRGKNIHEAIWIHVGIFILYILYFRMVLDSGLSADDMWNYNIRASQYTGEPSAWELTCSQFGMWLKAGRLFPFSNYVYLFFNVVPSITAYKTCIVLFTYISNMLCGLCISKVTKKKYCQYMYMLVFPLFVQLIPEFDSALYCYHMLIQVTVSWCFLALYSLLRYMDTAKKRYIISGLLCYLIALGTYEVSYVFVFVFVAVILYKQNGWQRRVQLIIPEVILVLAAGMANILLRINAKNAAYDGVTINLQIKPILITLLKQCSTCFPLGRYLCFGIAHIEPYWSMFPYSLTDFLQQVQILDVLTVAIYITIFVVLERQRCHDNDKKVKTGIELVVIGIILFVLPGALIAISVKYQNILGWCSGHLPAYMQSMGAAIVVLGIYGILHVVWNSTKKVVVFRWGCLSIAVIILLLNQVTGRLGVEYMNETRKYPQENIEMAAKAGLFDSVEGDNNKVVFGTTSYIYDLSSSRDFYSRFSEANIYADTRQEVVENLGVRDNVHYYAVTNVVDKENGIVILGECVKIVLNSEKTDLAEVWVRNPLVYLRGDVDKHVPKGWKVISDNAGTIYEVQGEYNIMCPAEDTPVNVTELLK